MKKEPALRRSALVVAAFIAVLWTVKLADVLLDLQLFRYGVYPREINGLQGILFGPLVHGSWNHLFANTLPLFVLGTALLYGYPRSAKFVIPTLYFGSELGVWGFARSSYHLGASGLTHGLMCYLFVVGVLRRDRQSIAISLLVFFLYGGMIWGIFPQDPGISFESHFFGALVGVVSAFLFRRYDPAPEVKKYDWEGETEDT